MAGNRSNPVICAGRAGVVEQEPNMQLGANPPCCMSLSQPGQKAPVLMPAWAGPCAAMAAVDAASPAKASPKARSRMSARNRLTDRPNMPGQHRTGVGVCQAARMLATIRVDNERRGLEEAKRGVWNQEGGRGK